jgi:hypothetical protein
VVRLFSFLVDKSFVPAFVVHGNVEKKVEIAFAQGGGPASAQAASSPTEESGPVHGRTVRVPLMRIAHGRSGDKGDDANIGIVARKPAFFPLLLKEVTAERVADHFAHLAKGPVTRYCLPGFDALNFVLERALGGGGIASLRYDPQGKAFAQILLAMPVDVPESLLEQWRT